MSDVQELEQKYKIDSGDIAPFAVETMLTAEEYEENVTKHLLSFSQRDIVGTTLQERMTKTVGRMMELIEVMGLPDKQEKAAKDNVKRVLWGFVDEFVGITLKALSKKCDNGCDGLSSCCDKCPIG